MTLDDIVVSPEVSDLRPDFAVLAITARGLTGGMSNARSELLLAEAERTVRETPPGPHPHIAAWHDAYRAFGQKPQRTPPSVDALWRRAAGPGLPRLHWLVDVYNAISVTAALPVGGENLGAFVGPLRLVRARGDEPFDTVKGGERVVEHPDPREVVWADDLGVTCRRWNWRRGIRTRLEPDTVDALFLLERLAPMSSTRCTLPAMRWSQRSGAVPGGARRHATPRARLSR
ncbi:MAG: phenylalanine--tRNA ligase beta subunit-related protein [Vicinamibacterales bacterium]